MPWVSWRIIASPPGRLPSGSIHMDPTGYQVPSAMACLMPSNTVG